MVSYLSTKGYSLLELMVTLLICTLAITAGSAGLQALSTSAQYAQHMDKLRMIVRHARQTAITSSARVVLCPLDNSQRCHRAWQGTLTSFIDNNTNRQLDDDELILRQVPAAPADSLRSYPRTAIVFDSRGFSGGFNGTLEYCLGGEDPSGIAIVISRVGRIRLADDANHSGLPNVPSGRDIQCPGE